MTNSSCSIRMSFTPRSKAIVIFSCAVLFFGAPTVFAELASEPKQNDMKVVAQKRMEKNIPGTYYYQSHYEMTKDGKGTYRSTYHSQKKEWFCCLNWFSSQDEESKKSEKS